MRCLKARAEFFLTEVIARLLRMSAALTMVQIPDALQVSLTVTFFQLSCGPFDPAPAFRVGACRGCGWLRGGVQGADSGALGLPGGGEGGRAVGGGFVRIGQLWVRAAVVSGTVPSSMPARHDGAAVRGGKKLYVRSERLVLPECEVATSLLAAFEGVLMRSQSVDLPFRSRQLETFPAPGGDLVQAERLAGEDVEPRARGGAYGL